MKNLIEKLKNAISLNESVLIIGKNQAGKSTLAEKINPTPQFIDETILDYGANNITNDKVFTLTLNEYNAKRLHARLLSLFNGIPPKFNYIVFCEKDELHKKFKQTIVYDFERDDSYEIANAIEFTKDQTSKILLEFEKLLTKYDVSIDSPDRISEKSKNEPSIARLYGEEYNNLENKIINILENK